MERDVIPKGKVCRNQSSWARPSLMPLDLHKIVFTRTLRRELTTQASGHHVGRCDDGPPGPEGRGPRAQCSDKGYSEARRQPTRNSPAPGRWRERANVWPDGSRWKKSCQPQTSSPRSWKIYTLSLGTGNLLRLRPLPHTEKAWVTGFSGPRADHCACVFWKKVLKDLGSLHHWVSNYRDIFKIQHWYNFH